MVAPGIAEALLATAIAAVAIPAVVIYNIFARQIVFTKRRAGRRGGVKRPLQKPRS
ncbi:MotA/TolQ/ExbB proton channel family protein [Salmonella enterica subsp. enterica]|nr:MotA/TolQ/ExbB proton channel family protein [Salmonella enterica subsp. enterica]